jgi:hypothetical protein
MTEGRAKGISGRRRRKEDKVGAGGMVIGTKNVRKLR